MHNYGSLTQMGNISRVSALFCICLYFVSWLGSWACGFIFGLSATTTKSGAKHPYS